MTRERPAAGRMPTAGLFWRECYRCESRMLPDLVSIEMEPEPLPTFPTPYAPPPRDFTRMGRSDSTCPYVASSVTSPPTPCQTSAGILFIFCHLSKSIFSHSGMYAFIRLLKSFPWFGTCRWSNSCTTTYSRNLLLFLSRSLAKLTRPAVEQDAHLRDIGRSWITFGFTPMVSAQ